MLFYYVCWVRIKVALMKIFAEFYERGTICKSMNATFIVLILNREESRDFSDFRLTSLVGSLYKVIFEVEECDG